MKKRLIPLLAVIAIAFAAVPDAQACVRCQFSVDYSTCKWGTLFGSTDCDDSTGQCVLSGESCRQSAAAAPLATEYAIASVERIDEPQQPAETLVASISLEQPAQQH
jgi:hypothetical protein